ncbi:MAG TPA: tRNA pseudouridine(55) synthase TruB [Pyrinomonadaceae bacterium]|nr:tRNA pseudouridine(55) synthase TruB [Pyrinomonadaceae bacterium]
MNGALIIDKPAGLTSHDVVARVRRIIGERRVGHTGTLDPFATGVLVVLVGSATRLSQFLSGAEKEYEATIRFGYATDTGDVTGTVLEPAFCAGAQSLRPEDIESALASFRGEMEQTPPMFSAKKIGGQKLYEVARRGEQLERPKVPIIVSAFEPVAGSDARLRVNTDATADFDVRVVCSAGTYVRTLAEDLGKRLGVGAHLVALRRTRAGNFRLNEAISLERLAELSSLNSAGQTLVSPDNALAHLPAVELSAADARSIRHGIDIPSMNASTKTELVRLRDAGGTLLAVGAVDAARQVIHPKVVLARQE